MIHLLFFQHETVQSTWVLARTHRHACVREGMQFENYHANHLHYGITSPSKAIKSVRERSGLQARERVLRFPSKSTSMLEKTPSRR